MATYPEDLDRPFTRDELSLLGVGWREVAGPLWRSPHHGVHVWGATDPSDPLQRALDASGLVGDVGAVGGWGAARIGGVLELDGRSAQRWQPVPVCLPPLVHRRPGRGIETWRSPLRDNDVTSVRGTRVTTPVRTAFDIVRWGSLEEAVVGLEVLARGRPELLEAVAAYAARRPGWHGLPQVRAVLRLASPRVRSPGESRFRLLWLREAVLPPPEVNATVRDGDGHLLGIVDLLLPEVGLVGEYDGAGHRAADQHARDNAREEALEHAGLVVTRATGVDLTRHRERTRWRLRQAYARAAASREPGWTWEPGPLPAPVPHW